MIYVLIGAGLLTLIAVAAVQLVKYLFKPLCPRCGSYVIDDDDAENFRCEECGLIWHP